MALLPLISVFKNNKGQSLIELLIVMGLFSIMLPALTFGMVMSLDGKTQNTNRYQAASILKELQDATRSARETSWNAIATAGTFYPVVNAGTWTLQSGTQTTSGFTKQVTISDVQRNSAGVIVTSGGTNDPATKKIVYQVSWTTPIPQSITSTEYFTRSVTNTVVTQTTQSDFDAGTKTNTRSTSTGGGTIDLAPATASASFIDNYVTAANYTYEASKIEVLNGFAQLKNQTASVSGNTTNPDFSTLLTPWNFATFNTNVGQTGTVSLVNGNPGGYAQMNFPSDKNKVASGYFYQAFTTTGANATATLTFQTKIFNYVSAPDSFRIYAFVDNASGAPTIAQNVYDSGEITATSGWSSTISVPISAAKMPTAGTYYVKLAVYLDYNNGTNKGPYTVGFDNAQLSWNASLTPSYVTTSPNIAENSSFTTGTIISWQSFSTVEVPNGGSITYQLSDDNGTSWKYYNGSAWVTGTTVAQSNSQAVVNANINKFPTAQNSIRVRAYLTSSGSQLVQLDSVTIGYVGSSAGTNTGTFTSSTIDAGATRAFNRISWTETKPASTSVSFQVATNIDNATWNYVGPDGTAATYFTNQQGAFPLNAVSGRYVRYQITFSSTTSSIPSVSDVTINYSQ